KAPSMAFKSGSTSENVDNLGKPRWTRPRVSNSNKGVRADRTLTHPAD
ncbi:MAG: hypothetical protein RI988_3319, partial [Pseudomonadota bacterium]